MNDGAHLTNSINSPAVMAGWLLAFTLSLDDVVVLTFVTGPSYGIIVTNLIYGKSWVKAEVNAIGTLLLVASLILVIISQENCCASASCC